MPDGRSYTCAKCGGTFVSDRPEAETVAEYDAMFPGSLERGDTRLEVCEVCWQEMIAVQPPPGMGGPPVPAS